MEAASEQLSTEVKLTSELTSLGKVSIAFWCALGSRQVHSERSDTTTSELKTS